MGTLLRRRVELREQFWPCFLRASYFGLFTYLQTSLTALLSKIVDVANTAVPPFWNNVKR